MLHFAVRRQSTTRNKSHSLSYLMCDERLQGPVIQHASEGFQQLFGWDTEYMGRPVSDLLGSQLGEVKEALAAKGLLSEKAVESIERMSKCAKECPSYDDSTADSAQAGPVVWVAVRKDGKLMTNQMSWRRQTHPVLGWSYQVSILQDISNSLAPLRLLEADEPSYQKMRNSFSFPDPQLPDLHDVAERVWKDELKKFTSKTSRNVETTSVWSRSTASTMASGSPNQRCGVHHLGAFLQVENQGSACDLSHDADSEADDFKSFKDESELDGDFSLTSSTSTRATSFHLLDPVEHLTRIASEGRLRESKLPFVIAASSVPGCPVALRSRGFEDLPGSQKVRLGCDMRDAFQPDKGEEENDEVTDTQWAQFCETNGDLWAAPRALLGLQLDEQMQAGEMAFKCSNLDCLVYVKHVELDEHPFLLALCKQHQCDLKQCFTTLSAEVDKVILDLASHFFYLAPMRRQSSGTLV